MSSLNKRKIIVPQGSLTLALNAAEGRLMLALGRKGAAGDDEIFFAQEWQAQSQGVELLTPIMAQALAALKLGPEHIGRLAVVNGPGGFTGLRLTTVTAAALARSRHALQAPLPYLPLLAGQAESLRAALGAEAASGLWVLTHARRGLIHMQGFTPGPVEPAGPIQSLPEMNESSPLLVLGLDEAASLLGELNAPSLLLGSGLSRNRAFFEEALSGKSHLGLLPGLFDHPSPAFLLRSALNVPDSAYAAQDIAPLYARRSDAEENLPHISAKLGMDAEEARRRLERLLQAPPQAQE